MVKVRKVKTEQEFMKCLFIRFMVFCQELQMDLRQEMDFRDPEATHFLVFIDEEPVGTCRYLEQWDYYLIGRLAVLPSFRKNGYGSQLLTAAVKSILRKDKNAKIELHAPVERMDFYKKFASLPFCQTFLENDVQHIGMRYHRPKK